MATLVELLPMILKKSIEGKIDWDSLSASSFVARIGSSIIEVTKVTSDTVVRLRDEAGNSIESTSYRSTSAPTDQMITDLYEVARKKGLRIDETLDALKKALDSL